MYSHGSTRAHRVCTDVIWCKANYVHTNPSGLGLDDCNDFQGTDRAELLLGVRVVADLSDPQAPLFAHAEEDADARSNRGDC